MKATAIACAVLAGTFGFSTLASAQDWGHRNGQQDQARHEQRTQQRHDRNRQAVRNHDWNRGQVRGSAWTSPQAAYHTPEYTYNTAPRYGYNGARFHRGGYVPRTYLQPSYYVSNWQAYPGLYAPPYGYQWVHSGNDFLLVALTTGLIANLLTR